MSQEERTGWRDLSYSRWHRTESMQRFMPRPVAEKMFMWDADFYEVCAYCGEAVALKEIQRSPGVPKAADKLCRLGMRSHLPVYSISYWPSADDKDIDVFRVQRRYPYYEEVHEFTPEEYAWFIVRLRNDHYRNENPVCGEKFVRLMQSVGMQYDY